MAPRRSRPAPPARAKTSDLTADLSQWIGQNLRAARRRQGHSLDTLARASGVSRAMLGQIETGKSVPTVTLLWKVAEALGVPVASLIARPDSAGFHIERQVAARVLTASNGQFKRRILAPREIDGNAPFQELRIAPEHQEMVPAQPHAGLLSLFVSAGVVDVSVDGAGPQRLAPGDAIFFPATSAHTLSNSGTEESIIFLVFTPHRGLCP